MKDGGVGETMFRVQLPEKFIAGLTGQEEINDKNREFEMNKEVHWKKVAAETAAVLGIMYGSLSFWKKHKKRQEQQNEDLKKDMYEGAGTSSLEREQTVYEQKIKRAIDRALSFCGLVVLAPVYVVLSLAIYIDDPGPVLFKQKRVGQNKEFFELHKFRSMKMSTPHDTPTHLLANPEQYITKTGHFLRKYSLDELPQIWDIFVGDRGIIGTTKKNIDFSSVVTA